MNTSLFDNFVDEEDQPVRKYDNYEYCPVCGGINHVEVVDCMEYTLLEAETECTHCGHTDYWATGYYESCQWGHYGY